MLNMTSPAVATNGASLTNCHTNVFALTELHGLQWKRFGLAGSGMAPASACGRDADLEGLSLADPVLVSYGRCLAANLLTAWKRTSLLPPTPAVAPHAPPPFAAGSAAAASSAGASKKLWVFWYGEEPDLMQLLEPELIDEESGSWENGLVYECRVLLFRALHTLIERCLLSQKYVRLGRWFIQPREAHMPASDRSFRYSYAFEFFLHGDSTVCTTVDVRMHPPLLRLTKAHIGHTLLQTSGNAKLTVILCPYGLGGVLTGKTISSEKSRDLLAHWKQYFPLELPTAPLSLNGEPPTPRGGSSAHYSPRDASIAAMTPGPSPNPAVSAPSPAPDTPNPPNSTASSPDKNGSRGGAPSPPVCFVEVVVSGTRMWYPSSFVLLVDDERLERVMKAAAEGKSASGWPVLVPSDSVNSPMDRGRRRPRMGARRCGLGGLPLAKGKFEQEGVGKLLQGIFEEFVKTRPITEKVSALCVNELADPADRKHCECEACRSAGNTAEFVSQRATSPVSSPSSYNAQGLGLMAMKIKAKEQPRHDQQGLNEHFRAQKSGSFHKRNHLGGILMENGSPRKVIPGGMIRQPGSVPPARRHVFGMLSPGASYGRMPATPQSQLGSVVQVSPVSSPASSMDTSDTSPTTPATPFPKTPRSNMAAPRSALPEPSPAPVQPSPAVPTPQVAFHSSSLSSETTDSPARQLPLKRPCLALPDEDSDGFALSDAVNDDWEPIGPKRRKLHNLLSEMDLLPRRTSTRRPRPSMKTRWCRIRPFYRRRSRRRPSNAPRPNPPLEWSKMFPTPPSLETHPISSPLELPGHPDVPEDTPAVLSIAPVEKKPVLDLQLPPAHNVSAARYSVIRDFPSALFPVALASSVERLAYEPVWRFGPRFQHTVRPVPPPAPTPSKRSGAKNSGSVKSPRMPVFSPPEFRPPVYPPRMPFPLQSPNSQALQLPEIQALLFNVLMGDTLMNLFVDKNFAACPLCVCNMTVRSDGTMLLGAEEPAFKCSCGFSAVMNRRLSYGAGLFAEDELDITGIAENMVARRKPALSEFLEVSLNPEQKRVVNRLSAATASLLKHQMSNPFLTMSNLHPGFFTAPVPINQQQHQMSPMILPKSNVQLQLEEMNRVCAVVLSMCRRGPGVVAGALPPSPPLHPWFRLCHNVHSHAEAMRAHRTLQPILQEAVQVRRQTRLWDKVFTVEGPLTWKDFLRFADKEVMEEQKEPLAVPAWLMGLEKERVLCAPSVWGHWEVMGLEPFGGKKDVVYAVVTPEGDYVRGAVKNFFRDLSKSYEQCGHGRHMPMPKLQDGIWQVCRPPDRQPSIDNLDDWFRYIGDSPLTSRLRLYASTCRGLAPHIQRQHDDKNIAQLFRPPLPPPPKIFAEGPASDTSAPGVEASAAQLAGVCTHVLIQELPKYPFDPGYPERDDPHPVIVIYLLDPFSYGTAHRLEPLHRLACVGLLRAYQELCRNLPDTLRESVVLQLIPLKDVMERNGDGDYLRALALSVYAQGWRKLQPSVPAKMLTGFGPATAFKKWMEERGAGCATVYTPPYVLLGRREKGETVGGEGKEKSQALFFAYCVTEDQRWLVVSCTDDRGELLETQIMNVWANDVARQKGWSVIRYSLVRLWDFILGVVAQLTHPCRIVIGRMGRLGHGELKGWSSLLSKKSLSRAGQQLKQMCGQCKLASNQEMPNILSACLVSLQPEASLRVMPDTYTHDDRLPTAASLCPLSSPEDASCSHLYVFPTSATAQAQSLTAGHAEEPTLGGDELDLFGHLGTDEFPVGDEGNQGDELDLFKDLFNFGNSPATSPRPVERAGHSPLLLKEGGGMMLHRGGMMEALDEPGQLLQQPLAVGYLVSTAPTGPVPRWFFAAHDHLDETSCPVVLMSALHIHSANVLQGDDVYHSAHHSRHAHPLDSNLTVDVLKYVLESYNNLSWLVLEPGSRDRRSCLPQHMQVLVQLYFAAAALL
ncbi:LOW QUALITY PROTEIN: mediator of RNA polymerase II transcription subunit 13-like [Paramacrobiotus metropolitanus]|uniref:LOW QUALITY PROTEIN: mediator of RNA polymerase II transcription subunit 13-like n=1 Tax=Paramacrobiotus metropolitanus TaxID=2943436 RepID=UPI002446476B|nr:LOW QUALITY PROTEIN: mediator of RNA polymerase II transcription subunit 13-like [Paramacrobiotus metropolitanus]